MRSTTADGIKALGETGLLGRYQSSDSAIGSRPVTGCAFFGLRPPGIEDESCPAG